MPIIVQAGDSANILGLASATGKAVGQREAFQRQQQYDQQFISQAIAASQARSQLPGYFERESQGHAAEGFAIQEADARRGAYENARRDAQAQRADDRDYRQAQLDISRQLADAQSQTADTRSLGALLQDQQKQASGQAAAEMQAFKRQQFEDAAGQGPESLAQFLAQEQFSEGKNVPVDYFRAMNGRTRGSTGPDQRKDVPQFQRDVEGQIGSGNVGNVLGYLDERQKADPTQPDAPRPLTQQGMQSVAALQHATGSMGLDQLRELRKQIVGNDQATDTLRHTALGIVDQSLTQRQKMRDVQIAQVYEQVIPKSTQAILASTPNASHLDRVSFNRSVGAEAIKQAEKFGISPAELDEYLSRQLSSPRE